MKALIAVCHHTGLDEFAKNLHAGGVDIVTSVGTSAFLAQHGIPAERIDKITGSSGIQGLHLEAFHQKMLAGLMVNHEDKATMAALLCGNVPIFDAVVVSLWGPNGHVSSEWTDFDSRLLASVAVRNHRSVLLISDHHDYRDFGARIASGDRITEKDRLSMAYKALRLIHQMDLNDQRALPPLSAL